MRAGTPQLAGDTLPPVTESGPCHGVRSPGLHPTGGVWFPRARDQVLGQRFGSHCPCDTHVRPSRSWGRPEQRLPKDVLPGVTQLDTGSSSEDMPQL